MRELRELVSQQSSNRLRPIRQRSAAGVEPLGAFSQMRHEVPRCCRWITCF
ncbi:hypothetical protein MJ588_20650 [Klebsiella pneumoniae]|nr:hypothetical protein MJ588_20650 [Klebsiella pneumoniae]